MIPRDVRSASVRGRIDREGRLVDADAALDGLNRRSGGEPGGPLAIPQLAALERLARRLDLLISRPIVAADGESDLDLWVRAQPDDNGVQLEIFGWNERPARLPAESSEAERDADFLRAAADWLWETDHRLRFTILSPVPAAAVGKTPPDFIGGQLTRLFQLLEDDQGGLPILDALADHRRFGDQMAQLRGARQDVLYRIAGVPLFDSTGRFSGFRGSATAEMQSLSEADSESLPPPTPFAGRLDKALRVPLDEIINQADAVAAGADGPLAEVYTGYGADIAQASRYLRALVDDLVDLQAIERPDFLPEREAIDLADLARRAAGLLTVRAADRHVRIDRPADDERLPAVGDFRRTIQILANLLSNAVRYSPAGSMVWIRCERDGPFAKVVIADQGKGIHDGDHEKIFGKFERLDQSEPGGNGLGLYIARRLARAMGGDIAVDSAPGMGARFALTLPAN